jgi:hypothetical protein
MLVNAARYSGPVAIARTRDDRTLRASASGVKTWKSGRGAHHSRCQSVAEL